MRSLRFVREVGPARWYIGRAANGDVCLFATTSSIGSMCAEIRKFKWATVELRAGGQSQLTAVLVADAYDRAEVTTGSAGEVIGPEYNVLFVEHDEPVEIRLEGDGVPARRVTLRYIGPFGAE